MSTILTVRLTKDEAALLARRAKRAGLKKATLVRALIREEEIVTASDALAWAERQKGDLRLRVRKA
jgi:hypothetical protein